MEGTGSIRVRRMLTALCVAGLMMGAAACGSDDGDSGGSTSASSGGSKKSITVGFVSPVASQPDQQDMIAGLKEAAAQLGWKVIALDANLSPDTQVSHLDTLLNQKVDAISTWALDPGALSGVLARAAAAKVPVVGINSEGPGINTDIQYERYKCDTGGGHYRYARFIAERKPKAKVLMIGGAPVPALQADIACAKKQSEAAGLQVVGEVDNLKDSAAAAQPLVADYLTKHPDVDAMWAYNDSSALGAAAAVTSSGKKAWSESQKKGIMIFGGNADEEARQAIKQDRMTMTLDAHYKETGFAVIQALIPVLKDGKPISAMPKTIELDSTLYDASNVDKFVPASQRKITFDNLPIYKPPAGG